VDYLLEVSFVELHFKRADLIDGLDFAYYSSLFLSITIESELITLLFEQMDRIQPLEPAFLSSGSAPFLWSNVFRLVFPHF
jgi:hypothetical protein